MRAVDWLKKKVSQAKKYLNPQPVVHQPSDNQRLSSYLEYRINDAIVNYIQVNNTRLYFQAFNKEETVQTLQDQYVKIHGKQMVLQNENIKIEPSMPLNQILSSTQNRHIFQEIVQKLEDNEKFDVEQIPPEKQDFIPIVKKLKEYQCLVQMKNGPRKPLRSKMKISSNAPFPQIIDKLNKNPNVIGKDIDFFTEKGEAIAPEHYDKFFESLDGQKEVFLRAQYSYKNSLLRRLTNISVRGFNHGDMPIELVKGLSKKEEIVSYNSKEMRMEGNRLGNFRQEPVLRFFKVVLALKSKEIEEDIIPVTLEATGSLRLLVFTPQLQEIWIPIEKLNKEHVIGGVDPRKREFALYKIETIEQVVLQQAQPFYSLQALPAHHFIGNNIIIHNCNSFSIRAKYLGNNPREEEVRFYRSDPLSKHFGERACQVGGCKLDNRMTFGDYQLDQFQIVYVYQGQPMPKTETRQRTISQWSKTSINYDQADQVHLQQINKKFQEEYFGIYNRRIIPSSQIQKIYKEKQDGVINILVALRMHFERINYHLNKEPQYANRDQKRFQLYHQDFKFAQTYQKCIEYGTSVGLKDIDILGIYLYTSDKMFGPLNKYLRQQYVKNIKEKDQQYLPDAGWIARSTKKTKTYRGVTYRGLRNIDLKKALNLDKYHPQVQGQDPDYKDKFVIFTNFTSTSKEMKIATGFAKKTGSANSLLTIQVTRGFEIEKYSKYDYEKQVLILPFTYFLINKYDLSGDVQTAELEQIPMPQTNSNQLIFWVDDKPESNVLIKEYMQKRGIEVVQVISTRIMRVILQNFFWIFKMLGRKVAIVSNMVRKEGKVDNYMAGIDLFQSIMTDYGLSNRPIFFVRDRARSENNLKERGIVDNNWVVVTQGKQLLQVVLEQFSKM